MLLVRHDQPPNDNLDIVSSTPIGGLSDLLQRRPFGVAHHLSSRVEIGKQNGRRCENGSQRVISKDSNVSAYRLEGGWNACLSPCLDILYRSRSFSQLLLQLIVRDRLLLKLLSISPPTTHALPLARSRTLLISIPKKLTSSTPFPQK